MTDSPSARRLFLPAAPAQYPLIPFYFPEKALFCPRIQIIAQKEPLFFSIKTYKYH